MSGGDTIIIGIPYEFEAQVRIKRSRTPSTISEAGLLRCEIPVVAAAAAPRLPPILGEVYRRFEDRLYVEGPPAAALAALGTGDDLSGAARRLIPQIVPPRAWIRTGANFLPPHFEIAERFADTESEVRRAAAEQAAELIVIDDVIYIPAPPPMLTVHIWTGQIKIVGGRDLIDLDASRSRWGVQYESLFSLDRWDVACAFSKAVFEASRLAGDAAGPWPDPERDPIMARTRPDDRTAACYACDDLIASARWQMPFTCRTGCAAIGRMDEEGLTAFADLRRTTRALQTAEGATRANARAAYRAAARLAAAGTEDLWITNDNEEGEVLLLRRSLRHAPVRIAVDPAMQPRPDEIVESEDAEALATLTP